jgi:hypothetical protein
MAVATRSQNDTLFRLSGELLEWGRAGLEPASVPRYRLTGTDSLGYFHELLGIDADWIVNLDDDAFLLDPGRLLGLVRHMAESGYAACGMPDGGTVRMRHHHPAACNAFFNVFDMRRVRPIWQEWGRVCAAGPQLEYDRAVADFARRGTFTLDHFERYYGVFFSLLDAGERILYLDAEEWQDGVSTLLKDTDGRPLILHGWYSRHWDTSYHTRHRLYGAIAFARQTQGLAPPRPAATACTPADQTPGNVGKWDQVYECHPAPRPYGATLTYEKAARFLGGLATVEDWGCGWAWFKRYLDPSMHYRGIDGSRSPGADVVADLTTYSSDADGILLRHVLEHNPDWVTILGNAVRSFRKRLVLVLFTPFAERTHVLKHDGATGAPDLSFARVDLVRFFDGLDWSSEENLKTDTQYGVEHVFYVERAEAGVTGGGGALASPAK